MNIIWRRVYIIMIVIILFLIILNYIPVKFALRIKSNFYQKCRYVCSYSTATDGSWYATCEDNPALTEDIYFNVYGTEGFSNLREVIDSKNGVPIINKYIFYGEMEQYEIDKGVRFYYIKSPQWNIVYPVQRQSLRAFVTPKSYLTVYDYDWGEIIKQWLYSILGARRQDV